MNVYILIVNYNSWQHSLSLVESISQSTDDRYQIVIIDNCSTDNSYHKLKSSSYHFKLLQTDKNDGFAYANNYFIKQIADEDAFVWLLNPDTLVDKDAFKHLQSALNKNAKNIYTTSIYSVGEKEGQRRSGLCKINKYLGITSHISDPKKGAKADYVYGASLCCHVQAFKEIGLIPEHYFLYWEETAWCHWAKRAGYHFKWVEEAIVYDKVSSLSKEKQFVSEYYYSLNALRFFKTYYPLYLPLVLCANVARYWYRKMKGTTLRSKAILRASIDFLKKRSTPPNQIN